MPIDYEKAAESYEEMFGFGWPMDIAEMEEIVDEYDGDLEKAYEADKLSLGQYDCLRDAQRD